MRTFYICDIHGDFQSFETLIEHVNFHPERDRLIIGGDLINRGTESLKMLEWARMAQEKHPEHVRVLIGNHEEMMIWFVNEISPMWMEFGGDGTLADFEERFGEEAGWEKVKEYAKWLESLPLIFEDEDAIYTHAGIDIEEDLSTQPRDVVWKNLSDLLGLDQEKITSWANGKPIYRGHNPFDTIYRKGAFVQCDLGNGTFATEDAALGLVDVKSKFYYRCTKDGRITEHLIEE